MQPMDRDMLSWGGGVAGRTGTAYGVWMTALGIAVFAFPAWNALLWGAFGLSGALAVGYGVRRHRPRRAHAWLLLAAGLAVNAAGDVIYGLLMRDGTEPFPSWADICYVAMFPLVALGVLGLARSGSAARDRARLLDVLTLTAGLAVLAWVLFITPSVAAPGLGGWQRVMLVAYPLGDVILFVCALRLVGAVRRTPAVLLVVGGLAGTLVADLVYGLAVSHDTWRDGGPADLGWLAFYALCGGAALPASMTRLTEPAMLRPRDPGGHRVLLLMFATLVVPVVLGFEAVDGPRRGSAGDALAIAILTAVMFGLVLARLAEALNIHRQALARERALRRASSALVAANDLGEVSIAVRHAVGQLLPPHARHRALFEAGEGHRVRAAAARLVPTETLEPRIAEALGGFAVTMLCPLLLDERTAASPRVAGLLVAADEAALVGLQDSVEVLTTQAAVAVERIALSREIDRRNSEEYFRTLVHNTADVILIVDDEDRIRYASPSAATVFGREPRKGTPLEHLLHPDHRAAVKQALAQVRDHEDGGDLADWRVLGGDGSAREVEVTCRDLRHDRTVRDLVVTLRDVTERRQLERELTHRAFHDSLTGLANRLLFQERVERAVAGARQHGTTVGVLFVDLDDFKIINDTMGHACGDELLVAVGQRLTGALRAQDIAARLGGDEFAALIEDAGDPRDVERVAERVVTALSEPFQVGVTPVSGAASVGVATTAEAGDAGDLLRQADLALYVAKGAGKGRWRRYQSSLHTPIVQRLELRSDLDRAVNEGSFTLEYQPIVAIRTGRTAGFEALVRWEHPTRGLIRPDEFIDLAEETGLIEPIGAWVLENALAAAAQWRRHGTGPYVSINVSARQFRTPGFVERVGLELSAADLPASAVMLEITESLLLRDDERVWSDLGTLRDLGVRVAIDDFGTGYSSLSYLGQTPIDVLKIDRSFVATIAGSGRQRALIDGVVRLAETLDLQVIAEGVETRADRDLLAEIGCPYGQGYLFDRPLSARDALRRLARERAELAAAPPAPAHV